jgi:uncharacterized damage-inducible protein DinB
MFRRVEDFLRAWERERESTLALLRVLDDASLGPAGGGEVRTLGRLAWHITTTLPEMLGRTGLAIAGTAADAPVPGTAREIADAYVQAAAAVAQQVGSRWSDADLETLDSMYGQQWPRGLTLFALVTHQAHHRGQMTVLMRQAGLKVPGVYGPAREQWAAMGLQPPAI